jgi:hypothetical protein
VILLTIAATLWGGLVLGPRRVVPFLLIFGPLFLPAHGSLDLPGFPRIDRVTAVTIPACLLMVVTPREQWQRFRFVLPDLFLLSYVGWAMFCTLAHQGPYACFAMGLKQLLTMVVPYFAGRLYLQERDDYIALVRAVAPVTLVYLGLMVFEARMYPRFQHWLYDQDVVGLGRFGLYRPVVFAENSLELGYLLALFGALMLAAQRGRDAARRDAGRLLPIGLCAACIGVPLTLSRGPVVGLLAAALLPLLARRTGRIACLLAAAGVIFFVWMLSPSGARAVEQLARIDPATESDQTLLYRFAQVEAFKPMVDASPVLGHGESWERADMEIIDGELLLTVLAFGYPGALLLCLFWLTFTWTVGQARAGPDPFLTRIGVHLAPLLGWLVFTAWGDSFLRAPHYVVLSGLLGVIGYARHRARARTAFAPGEMMLHYG